MLPIESVANQKFRPRGLRLPEKFYVTGQTPSTSYLSTATIDPSTGVFALDSAIQDPGTSFYEWNHAGTAVCYNLGVAPWVGYAVLVGSALQPLVTPDSTPWQDSPINPGAQISSGLSQTDSQAVSFSADGSKMIVGSQNGARIYRIVSEPTKMVMTAPAENGCPVAMSPDGRWAVSGREDIDMRLWQIGSSVTDVTSTWAKNAGAGLSARAYAWAPDSKSFIVENFFSTWRRHVYKLQADGTWTASQLLNDPSGTSAGVYTNSISPDGKYYACNGHLYEYDMKNARLTKRLGVTPSGYTTVFDSSGRFLLEVVVVNDISTIRVRDMRRAPFPIVSTDTVAYGVHAGFWQPSRTAFTPIIRRPKTELIDSYAKFDLAVPSMLDETNKVYYLANANIDVTNPIFDEGSLQFADSAANAYRAEAPEFMFEDFTVECQIMQDPAKSYFGSVIDPIVGCWNPDNEAEQFWYLGVTNGLNDRYSLEAKIRTLSAGTYSTYHLFGDIGIDEHTFASNTITHIALSRFGSQLMLFLGGVKIAETSIAGEIELPTIGLTLGCVHYTAADQNKGFVGKLDELRVTTGKAVYASAFAPPDVSFNSPNFAIQYPYDYITANFGAVWDIANLGSLFQDIECKMPVTTDGDAVARVLDLSGKGHDLIQPTISKRPLYRTDGAKHWLEFDGVDDGMATQIAADITASNTMTLIGAYEATVNTGTSQVLAEFGPNYANVAGAFFCAYTSAGAVYLARKGTGAFGGSSAPYALATPFVLSSYIDLAGTTHATEQLEFKLNAATPTITNAGTADTGAGPFSNQTLYIGSRNNGEVFPLNGKFFGAWLTETTTATVRNDITSVLMQRIGL